MRPVILLVFTACTLVAADAPTITCKPVKVTSRAELPASSSPYQPRPRPPGFEITYLVDADGLMAFKDGSLTITAITTAEGKNLATTSDGRPTWKQKSSKPISIDAHPMDDTIDEKFGTFTIAVSEDVFGKTDGLNVSGSIVALRGKRETRKIALSLSEPKVEIVDGLSVSLVEDGTTWESKGSITVKPVEIRIGEDKVIQRGEETTEEFHTSGSPIGIKVTGDIRKVLAVVLHDVTTRLEQRGFSRQESVGTWHFDKPTGDNVTVEITYWNAVEEVTIPIGKK